MTYSRRQLEAFGEPFGDSATGVKPGGRIYGGGGSSGGSTSTTSIPSYARPYVENMLGRAQGLMDREYQTYDYDRIAGFSPMQQQVQNQAAGYNLPGQTGQASGIASDVASRAQQAGQYQAGTFGNQFAAPQAYNPGQFTAFQAAGPQQLSTDDFTKAGTAEAYMSPYMQNVVDIQKREAGRQSGIMQQQQQAQMAQAGAYGGSRQAIIEAERQRNLGTQMGDIQAQGSQAAWQQAQQQFNADQARRLQAGMSNQGAGLQTNLANLQSQMTAQQQAEQSRQFGAQQGMTSAQLAAQYGLAGQQLGEQSRQFGANLGIQGLQQQLAAAGLLGNLGQQQYTQDMGLMNFQNQLGTQQQQQQQQIMSQDYQDFLNQQNYQYKQLGFMSDMLRGLPMSQTSQAMYSNPSMMAQIGGLGMAAYGMSRPNMAEGGLTGIVANKLMQG